MTRRKLTNQRDKRRGMYQWGYGERPTSNWGDGDLLSPYAEGDVVDVAEDSPAFYDRRIPHAWSKHPEECSRPGRYRVVCVFSIGEGDEWYLRVCPIVDGETIRDNVSDRIHMIPGVCNYAEGWTLVESADPENVRVWDYPVQLTLRGTAS